MTHDDSTLRRLTCAKQAGVWPWGRCDMRPLGLLITDYHKNKAFPLMKCIRRHVQNGPFWSWFDVNRSTNICVKNDFYIFVSSDLDLKT